jgi:hypothetical protein
VSQDKSRRDILKAAAVGTAAVVGGVAVEGEAGAGPAKTVHGPTEFTSTKSTAAVKAMNTGNGNAVAARASKGSALSATSNGGTTIRVAQEAVHSGHIAMHVSAKGAASSVVAHSADGPGLSAKASGAGVAVSATAASGTAVVAGSATGDAVHATSAGTTTTILATNTGSGTSVEAMSTGGTAVLGSTPSTASGATAVEGTVSSTAPGGYSAGVYGQNNGTGGSGIGVYGAQNGFGWGVYGTTPSGSGVYGYSSAGYGVQAGSSSGTGIYASSTGGVGVDAHSSSNIAVQGTSSSQTGVQGSSSSGYGVYGSSPTNYAVVGVTTSGNGVYGQVAAANQAGIVGRQLDASGNWAMYGFGNIGATGTKSAVVEATDGKGHMTLYCMESPECWFEDFGSAKLTKGKAHIAIDSEFAQTIELGTYHVFVQPEGECNGLSVREKGAEGFVVHELGKGTTDVEFSYRIVAKRARVVAPRLRRASLPDAVMAEHPTHDDVRAPAHIQ